VFVCPACGIVLDRDENAARNLAGRPRGGRHRTVGAGAARL